jgi:uncharacterized protein YqeY
VIDLLDKITKDMIDSMKNKDVLKLATLRMLKGAVDLERINKRKELVDEEIIGVIEKQIKTRKESIIEFEKGNRVDLVDKTNEEIKILSSYMPEALSEEEVNKVIDEAMLKLNASKISDMGNVMKEVSPLLRGKADMAMVSSIIKSKLN